MFVFSENSVEDSVSIVAVRYSFDPKLQRCQKYHKEWIEKLPVDHSVTESTHRKENELHKLGQYGSINEFL